MLSEKTTETQRARRAMIMRARMITRIIIARRVRWRRRRVDEVE